MADQSIVLRSGQLTRRTVLAVYTQGESKFKLEERDNPLPALGKSLAALVPVVIDVLHVSEDWAATLRVVGVILGEQGGATTVQFNCRKSFADASKEFAFKTPARLLAHPTEPGSYTEPLVKARAALVWECAEQMKAYIRGERAQGLLSLEPDDPVAADSKTMGTLEMLPGTEPAAGSTGKPAKQKRSRKSAPVSA